MHLSEPRGTTWVQQIHWTIPLATALIALCTFCLWYFGVLYASEALFAFIFMVVFAAPLLAARADFRERYQDFSERKKVFWALLFFVVYTGRLVYWIVYESPRWRWAWVVALCGFWAVCGWEARKWLRARRLDE